MNGDRFYEEKGSDSRRSAPAVSRNRHPLADVLGEWLPSDGLVLEIASGTGEHAVFFAERFPRLDWQPSDLHPDALNSIEAWRAEAALDQFIAAMRSIAERAKAGDQSLKAAPVHAPRRRLDETLAARKPVLVYREPEQAQAAE